MTPAIRPKTGTETTDQFTFFQFFIDAEALELASGDICTRLAGLWSPLHSQSAGYVPAHGLHDPVLALHPLATITAQLRGPGPRIPFDISGLPPETDPKEVR